MKQKFLSFLKALAKAVFAYSAIALGCAIMAVSFPLFFIDSHIAPGGFSGIATILHAFFGLNVGLVNFCFSFPLFLLTMRYFRFKTLCRNLFGTVMFSFFIDWFSFLEPAVSDLLLSALFGGILLGVGLGIAYRFNASTGGTDLLALLVSRKFNIGSSVGSMLLAIDFAVVAAAGIAFRSIELSLYALISIYVCMKAIDFIEDGLNAARAFFIFTDFPDAVKEAVFARLERGVTMLHAKGGYTGKEKEVLFVVVSRQQVSAMKGIVRSIDPKAFVVLTDAYEVLGEGFQETG